MSSRPLAATTPSPGSLRRLLVGGEGPVRFALVLEDVEGVHEWGELPARRREVNLPLLFDLPPAPAAEDRYARVSGVVPPAYLRLGPAVRAEDVPEAQVEPVPSILEIAAARWGWSAIGMGGQSAFVVLDAQALARLGAWREVAGAVDVEAHGTERAP